MMSAGTSAGQFAHLHVHTEYSILDGIASITELVNTARRQDAAALAITDHGVMYGAVDFYSECQEKGINPVIGCEVYVAPESRHSRKPSDRSGRHLTLLCRDNAGYGNLIQMVSKSFLEGFYQKPRVDRELLELHSEGIYCLSGCMSGELAALIGYPGADLAPAAATARWFAAVFPDRYFLEIQRHQGVPNLDAYNYNLTRLSKMTGIPLVATNDSHYVTAEQRRYHDLYMAIQTDALVSDDDRLHMGDGSYYLKTPAEMTELFSDLPESVNNAALIAQDCRVELDFNRRRMPDFPTPGGQPAGEYLRELCEQGFRRQCPQNDPRYRERLEYELEVIRQTQFADYFLIVWDIVRFTNEQGIQFGVRGSAAASLVLHCLGITVADPIAHRLVFERFLNLERKEMPDIDMDFQDDRRDETLNYVVERYGRAQVAQIITFGKYRPKSAVKAAARALEIPYKTSSDLATLIPPKSASVTQAADAQPAIRKMMVADPGVRNLVEQAAGIEGVVHQIAPHPAGIVIASEPLTNIAPLQNAADGKSDLNLTQYSMNPIAKLGLVKMDFLGLTNLTILDQALKAAPGAPTHLADIPLDDPATYRMLGTGNTANVFQLESGGMQRHIADLKPTSIGDIAAMIALYRPGPMENIERFIRSKHGKEQITYPHPSMKELLDETYGVIVYQDQVLQILRDFAGYSLGQADIVRKAMGKKIPELMRQERAAFLAGAAAQGYDSSTAAGIFDLIEPFAGYAFNKAHSISYALISYWTAYFKANHRVEYMTAALNCRQDQNRELYRATIAECRRGGIKLLPPCINESGPECTVADRNAIRLGLATVSGVGAPTVAPVLEERRQGGAYGSLADFCSRAPRQNLNGKQLEALAKAGSFDSLVERGHAVASAGLIWDTVNANGSARESGQLSMFGGASPEQQASTLPWTVPPAGHKPATPKQKAQWETQTLGIPLSWTPESIPGKNASTALAELPKGRRNQVTVAGFIDTVTRKTTRDQKAYLNVSLSLTDGPLEVMVWPSSLEKQDRSLWEPHNLVRVSGVLTQQGEDYSLSAETIASLEAEHPEQSGIPDATLHFTVNRTRNPEHDTYNFRRALRILVDYAGPDPVAVHYGKRIIEVASLTVNRQSATLMERLQAAEGIAL